MFKPSTYKSNELDLDTSVLEASAIFGSHSNSTFDRLSVLVQWSLFLSILVQLHVYGGPIIAIFKDNVNIDWRRKEERGHGVWRLASGGLGGG